MIIIAKDKLSDRLGVETFDQTVLSRALNRLPILTANGPWLAGGAVRRTLQGKALDSDFDFFFKSEQQAEDFCNSLTDLGAKLLRSNDMNSQYKLPGMVPEDQEGTGLYLPEMDIQVIRFRYYDSAEQVLDSFDFTLSQFAYDGANVYMADLALWDVARMKLVPHKITYATSSLRRLLKYTNQGFTVCAGALSNILEQVAQNPNIIEADIKYID